MNYTNFVNAVEGLAKKYAVSNPDMFIQVRSTKDGLAIAHGTRQQMRQEWVAAMLAEAVDDYPRSYVVLSDSSRKVLVMRFEDYWGDGNYGVAKCSPSDAFDKKVGKAVAYAHFRGYPIPDFI